MSTEGSTKAVVAALLANSGIAVTKFLAFLLTGASSMLAEAIHSVADSGNQGLLLLGGRQARRRPTRRAPVRLRPRALHLRLHRLDRAVQRRWSVRALRGLPQGSRAPRHPRPPRGLAARQQVGVGADRGAGRGDRDGRSFSFRTAIRETARVKGDATYLEFVRRAKEPELPGDPAGGLRGPVRPGVRAPRRRAGAAHEQPVVRRDRDRPDRAPARRGGRGARHRDQEPAGRRVGLGSRGAPDRRARSRASTASTASCTSRPCTSDPTSCWSPRRSPSPPPTRPPRSPAPSTPPRPSIRDVEPIARVIYLEPEIGDGA